MTFYPQQGTLSIEDFNSSEGAIFLNSGLQGILGGYVTLLNGRTGTTSIVRNWVPVQNWSFSNNLYDLNTVTGAFGILTGQVSGQLSRVTGTYGIPSDATAWSIDTSYGYPPVLSGVGYSGAGSYCLYLNSGTPNSILYTSILSGSQATTFEFDVASYVSYSGITFNNGFTGNQTALPVLSGLIGHGFLFSNSVYWDFIEFTPFGMRSLNHPEIAIPINLLNPTRVRVAFNNQDLYLSTQDGRSITAFNKFNTPLLSAGDTGQVFCAFGSVTSGSILTSAYNGVLNSVKASYGKTLWDNIKILTGQVAIYGDLLGGVYSTGFATMYTSEFNPGVAITNYLKAAISYLPYKGGETKVYAQYSGQTGWVDYSVSNLTGDGVATIDLNSFPVFSYPRQNLGTDYLSNPIRFKIEQKSFSGSFLPPPVGSITVSANKDRTSIDLLPDWKLQDSYVTVKATVQTGSFLTEDPVPERWSSFLVNIPYTTGLYTSFAFRDEAKNLPVTIVGTGEILTEGPYRSCFRTTTELPLFATSGSAAFDYFGSSLVYNFFTNPTFEEGFRQLTNLESNYYTGLTEGYLAEGIRIPATYTGVFKIDYERQRVYRPESQARQRRINSYVGYSTEINEYVQNVKIYSDPSSHYGNAGIEAVVPSGIATGNLLISFDLQVAKGSGIQISAIGNSTSTYVLPGEYFRQYSNVSFITNTNNNNEFLLRVVAPSGYNGDEYEFNIDNLVVSSYVNSYLSLTGFIPAIHETGIPEIVPEETSVQKLPRRAATILYGSLYLDSYPLSTGIVAQVTGSSGKGIQLFINNQGYLGAKFDQAHSSWGDGELSVDITSLSTEQLISNKKVPIGKWTNLAFYHDCHTYRNYSFGSIRTGEGDIEPSARNFASTNKAYLAIDGYPVASKDLMTGWTSEKTTALSDAHPFITYVDITGSCQAVIASGLNCKVDAVHLLRPPVSEFETEISIKGARAYIPYFVPDHLFKGWNENSNLLYTGPAVSPIGKDIYIGSCYNFSSPGFVNFDRGPIRNHLLTNGILYKEENNPYDYEKIFSTRFVSGAYAVAPYSSSFERLQSYTPLGIPSIPGFSTNSVAAFGWVYPRQTGTFFQAIQEASNPTGSRIELAISNDNKLLLNKYNSTSNQIAFTITGDPVELSGWSFVSFKFTSTGYTANLNTGAVYCYLSNGDSTYYFNKTGIDYGFVYQGLTGRQGLSEVKFGGTADINLFNWVLPIVHTGDNDIVRNYFTSGSKSGSYQTLLIDSSVFTGGVLCSTYDYIKFNLPPQEPGDYYYSLALLNSYNTIPKLYGINAYDNKPFKVVESYNLKYDTTNIESVFGANDSPIRIGYVVPQNAINIAKFSGPEYTVASSISSIDLSDYNPDNLNVFRQGSYLIGNSSTTTKSVITGYNNINRFEYSGRVDIVLSGQVTSADVEISTIPIVSAESNFGYSAFYYYLIGRGVKGVKVPGTQPHYTGQINDYSTGSVADNYIANLEKIKNSIKLKTKEGRVLPFDSYPYDISISSYPVDFLQIAVASGINFSLDNIGLTYSSGLLPSNVFTAILLTNKKTLDGESVFVHYDAYDYTSSTETIGYSEVVNSQPIYRERQIQEEKDIGKFDLALNARSYYDIVLYGIASGYSGKF